MAFDPDAYLEKVQATKAPSKTAGGFDPDAYLAKVAPQATPVRADGLEPVEPSMLDRGLNYVGEKAIQGLSTVSRAVDSYTGQPLRATIGSMQAGYDAPTSIKYGLDVIGEPTMITNPKTGEETPRVSTIYDLLENHGVSTEPIGLIKKYTGKDVSVADIAAFPTAMLLDPTAPMLKGAGEAARMIGQGAQGLMRGGTAAIRGAEGLGAGAQAAAKAAPVAENVAQSASHVPKSLQELVQVSEKMAPATELPSKTRLNEALKMVPDLKVRPTALHDELLSSASRQDEIKAKYLTLPSKEREAFDRYNQAMKSELAGKLEETAGSISGQAPRKLTEAGDDFMAKIDDLYKTNKDTSGPLFNELQNVEFDPSQARKLLFDRTVNEMPELAGTLVLNPKTTALEIAPFNPRQGLSPKEHQVLKQVVEVLDDTQAPPTFKDLQRTREFLRKSLDPTNPNETANLAKFRNVMLDHMDDLIASKDPNLSVRNTFKDYAKNEKMLSDVSSIIGGKVGGFDDILKADPSKVVKRVFQNPKTVRIAKEKLPPELFNQMATDYVGDIINSSFDSAKNTFSSAKLAKSLNSAQTRAVLEELSPEVTQRLMALNDISRIIPDMPNVNPSGTAKTKTMMEMITSPVDTAKGLLSDKVDKFSRAGEAKASSKFFDESLKGESSSSRPGLMGKAGGLLKKGVKKAAEFATSETGRQTARGASALSGSGLINKKKKK